MGQFRLFLEFKGATDMDAAASAPSSCCGCNASSPSKASDGRNASSKFMAVVPECCTTQKVSFLQNWHSVNSCNSHWQRGGAKEASWSMLPDYRSTKEARDCGRLTRVQFGFASSPKKSPSIVGNTAPIMCRISELFVYTCQHWMRIA